MTYLPHREVKRCAHGYFGGHVLWIVRLFRWYIVGGCNGSRHTRIEWGSVE